MRDGLDIIRNKANNNNNDKDNTNTNTNNNTNTTNNNDNEQGSGIIAIAYCMSIMVRSKDSILHLLSSKCPEAGKTGYSDPRPTIAEGWFLSLNSFLCDRNDIDSNNSISAIDDAVLGHLVGETVAL